MKERKKFTTAPHKEIDASKKRLRDTLWCCYCGEWRKFEQGKGWSYPRCVQCNISTEDFWVKTANQLWETTSKKKVRKKRK